MGPCCPTAPREGCLAPLQGCLCPTAAGSPRGPAAPWRGLGGRWVCVVRAVPSCCLRVGLGDPGPRAVLCKDRFFNSVLSAFKYLHLALCT